MKYVKSRPTAAELQAMHVVVLSGISEQFLSLKVIGWVEDAPHTSADEAVLLYEPLHFIDNKPANGPVTMSVVNPRLGVPISTEFFEYNKVEVYEGISPLGVFYIDTLSKVRFGKQEYALQPIVMPEMTRPIGSPPQTQQQPMR